MTAQPTHEAVDRLTEALHEHSIRRLVLAGRLSRLSGAVGLLANAMTVYRASGGGVTGKVLARRSPLREAATLFRQAMPPLCASACRDR